MTIREAFDRAAELAGIKRNASNLHAGTVDLAADHATGTAKRTWYLTAPEPVEAKRATLDQDIAALAAAKLAALGPALRASLTPALVLDGDSKVTGLSRPISLAAACGPIDLGLLCLLVPAAVRKGLAQAIPDDEGEPAPAMHDRVRLIADLDVKLRAIEAEHAALVDQAATVGVVLEHLEPTRAKRLVDAHTAAYRQERDERDQRANSRSSRLVGR